MAPVDDSQNADVFDFLDEYISDQELGEDRTLTHYLARFPNSTAAIAREWLRLRHPQEGAQHVRPSAHASSAGEDRIGPYKLLRELGRGGQGTVWLAEDTRIVRRVALKVLTTRFNSISDEQLRRFRREAEVISRLEHPGLCTIFEADLDGSTPYIAMRLVEGRTLAEVLTEARSANAAGTPERGRAGLESPPGSATRLSDTSFPPRSVLDLHAVVLLFERAARALHAAHEAGVIHRDVKPGNIIVTPDGRPVLLDFGLARDEQSDVAAITQSGDMFGTPAYMSPEQLRLRSDELDPRTDVYSLGIALYEALTLERPFDSVVRPALFAAIHLEPVPDPCLKNPSLPADLRVVIETALEKPRERRYATALEFAEDLRRVREYEPIRARPASVWVHFARWTKRHPAIAVGTIGTILSLAIGLALTLSLLASERVALSNERAALTQKREALSVALGNHLAQRCTALVSEDPSAALRLGIEAVERAPSYLTRSTLYGALEACWMRHMFADPAGENTINDIALSPDGRELWTAHVDGDVFAWSMDTWEQRLAIPPEPGPKERAEIERIAPSADGRWIGVARKDGCVRILARASGALTAELRASALTAEGKPRKFSFPVVAFETTRPRLVVLRDDGLLARLDAEQPAEVVRHELALEPVAADLAQGGRTLLIATTARPPIVVEIETGAVRIELAPEWGPAQLCRAGRGTASAWGVVVGVDGRVRRFELETGHESAPPVALESSAGFLALAPDGQRAVVLASRAEPSPVTIVDFARGSSQAMVGHEGALVNAAEFSPSGRLLATASFDCTVRIFDVASGAEEKRFPFTTQHMDVHFTPDELSLVSRSKGPYAHAWFVEARTDVFDLRGHTRAVRSVAFAPDGKRALTAADDGTARVWHVPHAAASVEHHAPGECVFVLEHGAPLVGAAYASDGETILSLGTDRRVRVWDAHTATPRRTPIVLDADVVAAEIDAGGDRVVTLTSAGVAQLWPARTETGPIELTPEHGQVTCIELSSEARVVACGTDRDEIDLFDARSGAWISSLTFAREKPGRAGIVDIDFRPGHDEIVAACVDQRARFLSTHGGVPLRDEIKAFAFRSLDFDARGERLIALGRSGGGAVRILDRASGEAVFSDQQHTDQITSAAFSPDGQWVCTASRDRSARVWSAKDGVPLVQRVELPTAVTAVAIGSDGQALRVMSGFEDGRVSIWPLDPVPAAHARRPRKLIAWEQLREEKMALPLRFE